MLCLWFWCWHWLRFEHHLRTIRVPFCCRLLSVSLKQRKALCDSWENNNVDDWLVNMGRKRDRYGSVRCGLLSHGDRVTLRRQSAHCVVVERTQTRISLAGSSHPSTLAIFRLRDAMHHLTPYLYQTHIVLSPPIREMKCTSPTSQGISEPPLPA